MEPHNKYDFFCNHIIVIAYEMLYFSNTFVPNRFCQDTHETHTGII